MEKATEKMVANHQWMPAGYKVSHHPCCTVLGAISNRCYRRNSEIYLFYRLLFAVLNLVPVICTVSRMYSCSILSVAILLPFYVQLSLLVLECFHSKSYPLMPDIAMDIRDSLKMATRP